MPELSCVISAACRDAPILYFRGKQESEHSSKRPLVDSACWTTLPDKASDRNYEVEEYYEPAATAASLSDLSTTARGPAHERIGPLIVISPPARTSLRPTVGTLADKGSGFQIPGLAWSMRLLACLAQSLTNTCISGLLTSISSPGALWRPETCCNATQEPGSVFSNDLPG